MPRNEDVAMCCSGHLPSCHLLVILKPFRGVHRDTQRWASDAAKGRCCGVLLSGHLPSCHLLVILNSPWDSEVGIRCLGGRCCVLLWTPSILSSSGNFAPSRGVHRDTEEGIRCRRVKTPGHLWTTSVLSFSGWGCPQSNRDGHEVLIIK
jgi:hypothetical protein